MRVACFCGFVSALLAVACGGGVNVSTSASNVCNEIAEVACHNLYQCCTEGQIESYLGVSEPRSEEQCREDVFRRCKRASVTLDASIEAGRVRFSPELMNTCLDAIVAPGDACGEVVMQLPWEDACLESAWVGVVELQGACFFNHDCAGAPDNFCAPNQKCTAKPTAGFPCGTGCASAFYCGTGGICQPKVAVGGPCLSSLQCQKDLFCDTSAGLPMGSCATKQPGGAACRGDDGCVSENCVPGKCMGTNLDCFSDTGCSGRCADDGFPCTVSSTCSTGTCSVGGNLCTVQTQCVAGGGDTCVFPVLCLPGDCIGDPVCTDQTLSVNYCSAVSEIPLI